jgi:hypothetical protein
LGYIKGLGEDISGQARQSAWTKTLTGEYGNYSPFFVDLVDDFNQASYYGSAYNDDRIKDLHYSVIMKIARECTYWADCKSKLRENSTLVNQGLDTFLEPYDYWFSHR